MSSFVGRQEETIALVAQLRDGASLLTLVGIGGIGKTRLATHVAAQVQADYFAGARFVSLAPLSQGANVAHAVIAALGLREKARMAAVDTLAVALRGLPLLLVLDNCEHVIQASAELVDQLLRRCPLLQILATSREALGVPGERVVRIWPLPVPTGVESVATVAASAAVELFVARASAAEPPLRLTADSAASVGRICRLLDGIPLAIELAAARTRTMNLDEITRGLGDPLALLTLAPRTAPARQQTLRATIDWSYALLTASEQTLLRRLAVFAGGFTLGAVQAVCTEPELPLEDVPDLLDRLASKSLLIVRHDQEPTRFTMRETLRIYLLARLETAGERDGLRARHRDWCLGLAERVSPELVDSDQARSLQDEQANLRAALQWALESDQAAAAARLSAGLAPMWLLRGRFAEGRALLTAVSELPSAAASPVEISLACSWAAVLAHNEGIDTVAEELAGRALALAQGVGHKFAIMTALSQLGWAALGQGDLNRAANLYEMAWESAADAGGPVAAVIAYFLAVTRLELGNVRHAEQLLAQATDLIHAAGFRTAEGRLLTLRANFAERAGDQQATDALLADAVALERTIDSQPGLIEVLTILGSVMVERGQRARAVEPLREAFGLAVSHGAHVRLARVLEAMSGALIDAHPSASVRLAVAAQELRDTLQALPLPSERARLGRYLEEARQRLGEAVYAEISSATRLQPTDVVIDECFLLLDQVLVPAPPTPSPGASAATADLLTEREREVVVLLTHGLNNREIAEELVVTRKTVESHISHILTKLDLTSRLQVATWAYEHGPAQPSVTMLAVN